MNEELNQRVEFLIEALPFIRQFQGKTLVIKYGGSAMKEDGLREGVMLDVILLRYVGMRPVIVHGGGPQIDQVIRQVGLEPKFVDGLRVTDEETMRVVEMVLVGDINSHLVSTINRLGGWAVGLNGKDGGMIRCRKMESVRTGGEKEKVDLGWVGEVVRVEPRLLWILEEAGFIPCIAPIGADEEGHTYNINADSAAGEVAAALSAEKLILLSDTDGILDAKGNLMSTLHREEVRKLIRQGVIQGGMIPKVQACVRALEGGVGKAHIINGKIPHSL
ncbi:MAG: acetylglutamate kinase, partial [candidate division NC10 bacterium]|nr:acetylglutamate kinase [candidate division NC10 bacterium]